MLAGALTVAGCTSPGPRPPAPTGEPSRTAPAPAAACVTGALLVPSCGVLWGAAAGGFTAVPRDVALTRWEAMTGRTATIFHTYHRGDEAFPTPAEIAMTRDPAHPRVLLMNWRVSWGMTWAEVADGGADARIDRWAAALTKAYPERFFLVLDHEPEAAVDPVAGSGMTAADYAAMYRHVVRRIRDDGVDNAVTVLAYMSNERWMAAPWWQRLYPGDGYVDWIGLDSYASVERGSYHYGGFGELLDRPSGPDPAHLVEAGFYDRAVADHPGKPIMVTEWGMYRRTEATVSKAAAFGSVLPELRAHPAIKALVYFDAPKDKYGNRDISVDADVDGLAAFRRLATAPMFDVGLR